MKTSENVEIIIEMITSWIPFDLVSMCGWYPCWSLFDLRWIFDLLVTMRKLDLLAIYIISDYLWYCICSRLITRKTEQYTEWRAGGRNQLYQDDQSSGAISSNTSCYSFSKLGRLFQKESLKASKTWQEGNNLTVSLHNTM